MANTVVTYHHFASGKSLELHLHPATGGAKVNATVALSQPAVGTDPYRYQLIVPEPAIGWFKGFVVAAAGSTPLAIADVYLNDDAQNYLLGQRAAPPIVVDQFTTAAKNSLGKVQVSFSAPTWNADLRCFDRPITQGDDYLANLALTITIATWPGRSLLTATTIILTARRISLDEGETANTFAWSGTAAANGSDVDLVFSPTSVETDQPPGTYTFDVQATWSGPSETHSPVLPGARLEIAEDVSL